MISTSKQKLTVLDKLKSKLSEIAVSSRLIPKGKLDVNIELKLQEWIIGEQQRLHTRSMIKNNCSLLGIQPRLVYISSETLK
jgi:hypothetical protein